ncbi:MAG: type II toxin-antitoxin system PemK/MazF family toxin [Hyphomicrobium sp.]
MLQHLEGQQQQKDQGMLASPVRAGTILYLDFSTLNFEKPHFTDGHPVVVVSPEGHQKKNGMAYVVPLTSEVGNRGNTNAVEVNNATFLKTSPTGRSFAICDKMISVPLQQLDRYRPGRRVRFGQNRIPDYQLSGEELKLVRLGCTRMIWSDDEFRMSLSDAFKDLLNRLKMRQERSHQQGRKIASAT